MSAKEKKSKKDIVRPRYAHLHIWPGQSKLYITFLDKDGKTLDEQEYRRDGKGFVLVPSEEEEEAG